MSVAEQESAEIRQIEAGEDPTRFARGWHCLGTEEDGPVYQQRRWYEQFYVDVEDVTPDMTDRFEFEIDTTHSIENWEAEVADNLAASASA